MEAKGNKRLRVVWWFLAFSVLPALTGGIAWGEGLYTRTDELSCGNTVVQAYTTCTEDSHDLKTAVCVDQHFLFINKRTGAANKVDATGKPVVDPASAGGKIEIRYDALARDWACLESGTGSFIYLEYTEKEEPSGWAPRWEELLNLKGRRLATLRMTPLNRWPGTEKSWRKASERVDTKYTKVWNSKGLPGHPAPYYEFVPIQIFKTDRADK